MNMQKLLQEAKKMQIQLQKDQQMLDNTIYEGSSSIVNVKMNGKYEITSVNLNINEDITVDDKEMLEDMVMIAINDAVKKVNDDKEKKMSKYGSGIAGLM